MIRFHGKPMWVVSLNPEAYTRRPNCVRKGGHTKGKNDCLKLSHI